MNLNNITIKEVVECGKQFYNVESNKIITRYESWIFCHDLFIKTKKDLINNNKTYDDLDNNIKDKLCLYLSNYLSSWGMYRNSFLLWSNYMIHDGALKIIFDTDDQLWNMNYNNCDEEKLETLINNLNTYYKNKRTAIYKEYNKLFKKNIKENRNVSDTLISKILLGTIACSPAYDQYFSIGVKTFFKGKRLGSFNAHSIKKLLDQKEIQDILKVLKKSLNIKYQNYPDMKLLDSCFWQLGYYIEQKK